MPTYDRKWAVWRHRFEHLALTGRARPRLAIRVVNWCGYSQDFVAWPDPLLYRGEIAMKSALVLVVLLVSSCSGLTTSTSTSGMGWVVTVIAGPTSAEGDAAG